MFFKVILASYYQNQLKISVKESNFQKSWNERLCRYISRIVISVAKQFCYVTVFLVWTLNFVWSLNFLWPERCMVMSVYGSKIPNIKKGVVKTLLNIFLTVKTEWPNKCMSTQKFFKQFLVLRYSNIVVHSKPFIKISGICYS